MNEETYEQKTTRYQGTDIAKFIACICVFAIHTGPLVNANATLRWGLYATVIELAVPFFFVSSGFFSGKNSKGHATYKRNY